MVDEHESTPDTDHDDEAFEPEVLEPEEDGGDLAPISKEKAERFYDKLRGKISAYLERRDYVLPEDVKGDKPRTASLFRSMQLATVTLDDPEALSTDRAELPDTRRRGISHDRREEAPREDVGEPGPVR